MRRLCRTLGMMPMRADFLFTRTFYKGLSMLALTRKPGQVIVIGDGPSKIEIMVVRVDGDKVRIAIDAPRDIPVNRLEVYEEIRRVADTPPPQNDVL